MELALSRRYRQGSSTDASRRVIINTQGTDEEIVVQARDSAPDNFDGHAPDTIGETTRQTDIIIEETDNSAANVDAKGNMQDQILESAPYMPIVLIASEKLRNAIE